MKIFKHTILIVFLTSMLACTKFSEEIVSPHPSNPQAGYVTGTVRDNQNRPIQGAEITINNTGEVVNNLIGYTDANGNYKIKLTTGGGPLTGSYYVRGHLKVSYQNQTFNLALFVEDDSTFSGEEGAVKNLHLAIRGPRTNFGDSGYYGGTIEVDNHTSHSHFPNIEVTMQPVGPLLDGSAGETQVARPDWLYSYNVPLGKYKITARDVHSNQQLAVKNYYYDKEFNTVTTGVFEAATPGSDRYNLVIVVADL